MALIVQKYGGTSVDGAKMLANVAERVIRKKKAGNDVVVVVSAPGDMTDELIEEAHQITDTPNDREMDMLLSTGEQKSIALMAITLNAMDCPAVSFTGQQVEIETDAVHRKARIVNMNCKRIKDELKKGKVVVIAGFQGVTKDDNITTLGRGGSDITAVALAAVLKADVCEKYTDEEGIYTADPRIVKNARKLKAISYDEMMELASLGAKVIQTRSVLFAKKHNVKIHVRSSMSEKEGTVIMKESPFMENVVVSGVTNNREQAKVTVVDIPDKPGMAGRIFGEIAGINVNADMIVQSSSDYGTNDISFTVSKSDLKKTISALKKISGQLGFKEVKCDDSIAVVSVVGIGMKSHPGVASKAFEALGARKINIEMISTSEISISCVVKREQADDAVRVIHDAFELSREIDVEDE